MFKGYMSLLHIRPSLEENFVPLKINLNILTFYITLITFFYYYSNKKITRKYIYFFTFSYKTFFFFFTLIKSTTILVHFHFSSLLPNGKHTLNKTVESN